MANLICQEILTTRFRGTKLTLKLGINMEADVQSGHLVTGAESYKPKATLWHKGSGSGKVIIR